MQYFSPLLLALPALVLGSCAQGDEVCLFTSDGFKPAVASVLIAAEPLQSAANQAYENVVAQSIKNLPENVATSLVASLNAAATAPVTNALENLSKAQAQNAVMASVIPTSLVAPVSSVLDEAIKLQAGSTAAPSAASTSSHGAAAAARPTDLTLMAMAGAVAGVAGVAYGL